MIDKSDWSKTVDQIEIRNIFLRLVNQNDIHWGKYKVNLNIAKEKMHHQRIMQRMIYVPEITYFSRHDEWIDLYKSYWIHVGNDLTMGQNLQTRQWKKGIHGQDLKKKKNWMST